MTESKSKNLLERLFSGKKERWLPLYRRMIARLSRDSNLAIRPTDTAILIGDAEGAQTPVGEIRVRASGLHLGLALGRQAAVSSARLRPSRSRKSISHQTLVSSVEEIDEELLSWIKAAKIRTARR